MWPSSWSKSAVKIHDALPPLTLSALSLFSCSSFKDIHSKRTDHTKSSPFWKRCGNGGGVLVDGTWRQWEGATTVGAVRGHGSCGKAAVGDRVRIGDGDGDGMGVGDGVGVF
ncbi:hypothetical protein Q3G72_001450 [Acer saccharum]|nr:hypothetical protein Q3G72_001450 [Acer saccharum]